MPRGPLKIALQAGRHSQRLLGGVYVVDGFSEGRARREVERDRRDRELPLMVDRERRVHFVDAGEGAERHLAAITRREVDLRQVAGPLLKSGSGLQHDAVLIQLREHRRDLTLPEGVVQRIVDHLRRDAEPRGGVAIDVDAANVRPSGSSMD